MTPHTRFLSFVTLFVLALPLSAQDEPFHPELDWHTIETPHLLVHYHTGAEWTAEQVARIAESIYGPVTRLYHYEPDQKVSFIVRDHDDYSNGASYFFDNKIELWAPALDFELRGVHPWLWNVVTHEFTHMVQIQTTLKLGRRVPAIYLQWLGYEEERRPDVLYGYPNVLVSYPFSGFVVPSWFAEGVAQYNNPSLQYDYWDTHRDMILRMYLLSGRPLSWEEMAVFGKTSLGNESAYNAGFSLVSYIADKYGVDKLEGISRRLGSIARLTIDGAIEDELGITGKELYRRWIDEMTERYTNSAAGIRTNRREGELIEKEGFGNADPAFSPDGTMLAFVSNKGEDYFGASSIYLLDRRLGTSRRLVQKVRSTLSFSPDGRYLYYSKATRDNPHWSSFNDLYRYDLREKREERLSHAFRASYPSLSPDGKTIACVIAKDGSTNLALVGADGKRPRMLTRFGSGEQVYSPAWSPDGRTIAFAYSTGHNQSIALIDTADAVVQVLSLGGDARTPAFSRDGRALYFSWDTTGIFNIHRLDLDSGRLRQITNVLGGAFQPALSPDTALAYVNYTETGFKLSLLTNQQGRENDTIAGPGEGERRMSTGVALTTSGSVSHDRIYDTLRVQPRPYRSVYTSLSLIPVIRVDNYNEHGTGFDVVKPGLYFSSGEVLDKISLFGGAAINRQLERDLFLILEYRDRLPLLYQIGLEPVASVELYSISRKTNVSFPIYVEQEYNLSTDVTYDLFEFDLSLRQNLFTEYDQLEGRYALSRYAASLGSFLIPYRSGAVVSPAFRNVYLIGDVFSLRWRLNAVAPTVDRDINPVGRTISLRYSRELNKYNRDLEYDDSHGYLVPLYKNENFHRLELQWNEHVKLPWDRQTLSLGLHAGTIQGMQADTIFNFYAGGFIGMRGYPFYAIEGNHLATVSMTYRFPLWTTIDTRFLQFYFTKLFASVFADAGNAWNGNPPSLSRWKTDAGFEFRLEAFSFYAFPTRIFFSGAYGFDRFTRSIRDVNVTYGKEWRFYLGVLFGFELTDVQARTAQFLPRL